MTLPNKASRDAYMKNFEKRIYKENEAKFKELTLSQGKLIIRLLDRETNTTSFELIKAYRGSLSAGFWQMFAVILERRRCHHRASNQSRRGRAAINVSYL